MMRSTRIIAFDELRTDFKSPIDQCNPVHASQLVVHQRIWYGLVDELWVPFLDARSGTQLCPSPKSVF
ncbi:hypothetical protein STEG23_030206 [Scotinomys teguina]